MLDHITAADLRKTGCQMGIGGLRLNLVQRVAYGPRRRNGPPAPGAAEVNAVEMDNAAVRAVIDDLVVGNAARREYVFVEFEDAEPDSVFKRSGVKSRTVVKVPAR